MEPGEFTATLRRLWRIPVVAVIAATLAFAGSFVISPTYESSTQLLIRGRDTSFLTTTGEGLREQPGVIDAALATALGETQSALLSSHVVAEVVVEDLGLDTLERPDESGLRAVRSAVRDGLNRVRAYLTHGFYAEPDPYDAAVAQVHEGLGAEVMHESYVLELTAQADSPELAAAIANSAADALVEVSRDRFRTEADSYREYLGQQLDLARGEEREAADAIRAFKEEHGLSELTIDLELTATGNEELRRQLRDNRIELAARRAELSSVRASLAQVSRTSASTSEIITGRSTTTIEASGDSNLYEQLAAREAQAEADVAALDARQASLEEALDPELQRGLTAEEAEMRELELRYAVASDTVQELSRRHTEAVLNAGTDRLEVTRVDVAGAPTYPASPTRYLYLLLGAVLGALAGLLLTALSAWRRGERLLPAGPDHDPLHDIDLTEDDAEARPVPAGAEASTQRTRVGRYEVYRGEAPPTKDAGGSR